MRVVRSDLRLASLKAMKTKKSAPTRTFAWLFPASGCTQASDDFAGRIRGGGVSLPCEDAEATRLVVEFLESVGIPVKRGGTSGICAADSYSLDAPFLDGGLWAETGNYIGQPKFAQVSGARAALFVALGLGLRIPAALRAKYALPEVGLDELKSEALALVRRA